MNNKNLNVMDEMYYSDLWIKLCKNSRQEILTKDKIERYNEEGIKEGYVCDIFKEQSKVDREYIITMINGVSKVPEGDRYKNGSKVNKAYYDRLIDNMNLQGIKDKVPVEYGLVVKRGSVRIFPTSDRVFKGEKEYGLDRFMESAIYVAEPCAVYTSSKDGKWCFCKAYNYSGWIKKENIAIGSKREIEEYCNCKDFIVVTGKKIYLGYNPFIEALRNLDIDMGVKLPIEDNWSKEELVYDMYNEGNYVVKYPLRESNGELKFTHILIPYNEDVHRGYLKCNINNILNQIFKFQGERYGWGGEFNGRDCSSLIIDTFRTFGIRFPRNSGDQLKITMGKTLRIDEEMIYHERRKILDNLKPGALIFLNGHVVMFIGNYKNSPYIIHDVIGVFINKKDDEKKNKGNKEARKDVEKIYLGIKGVTVSELKEVYTSSGKPYIEEIIGIKDIFS
jgi:hypothetical protein